MQIVFASAFPIHRLATAALAVALIYHPCLANAQQPTAGDEEAPFVDPFEGDDEAPTPDPAPPHDRDLPRLGTEEEPYEEFPERQVIDVQDQALPERPEGPVELRFRFNEPMRFDVSTTSRMGFEDRPGLRQLYRSGMAVEYRPLTELQRAQLPTWQMQIGDAGEATIDEGHQIVLASVSRFSGSFDEPHELSDSARTHQILKDAQFSFRVSPRGHVSDVKVHPPTNPLARSSLEEMIRLLVESHPQLPEEAVAPGDSWTQRLTVEADDESVVRTQEVELEYTFNGWTRCGRSYCARIDVEQSNHAAGRYVVRHIETRSATAGGGSGWFLLDLDRGRVVRSTWNIDSQGHTTVRRRKEDTIEEVTSIRFHLVVDTTLRLIERSEPTFQLVPTNGQD